MTYPSLVVANEFIRLGVDSGRPVDPMKLQKLVYVAHGWSLALKNQPLIRDTIEAWPYGPVVPNLYSTFKAYKAGSITAPIPLTSRAPILSDEDREFIGKIWQAYGGRTAIELSVFTHEPGFAWDLARKASEGSPEISDALIRDEFLRRKRDGARH